MSGWDWWRMGNAIGALIAMGFAITWTVRQWFNFIPSERIRWLSFDILLFSCFYSPIEVVFWPQLQLRVPILTVGLLWAFISLQLKPRFPREGKNGRQSRISETRTRTWNSKLGR